MICTSPNDVIVHGIPSADVVLEEGDILSIDCGAIIEGWHGDAAFTVPVGEVDDESKRLIEVTERRCEAAIDADGRRATASATSARRSRASPSRPGSRSCASTSATASAPPCTRTRRSRTTGPAGRGLKLKAGPRASPSSRW